jgi:hypothetical protein
MLRRSVLHLYGASHRRRMLIRRGCEAVVVVVIGSCN